MDKVSDERIADTIYILSKSAGMIWEGRFAADMVLALMELQERRLAEKVKLAKINEELERALLHQPYEAEWTSLECPKCHHENVCIDNFGYRCFTAGCGWTKDEP